METITEEQKNKETEPVRKDNSKKKIIIVWVAFALCVIVAVILWFVVNNSEVEYEEVKATVVSSETKQIVNRKRHSTTNLYEVKVRYDGKTYDLENAHNSYSYQSGKSVTAYLANDRMFANVEGVKTSTPVSTAYYIFLIGSFVMLIGAATYTANVCQKKKQQANEN